MPISERLGQGQDPEHTLCRPGQARGLPGLFVGLGGPLEWPPPPLQAAAASVDGEPGGGGRGPGRDLIGCPGGLIYHLED